MARALNDAFDGLEGALARERQLTSDVSHELRTPVATLVAETTWALGSPRSADEYRRSLEVCAASGAPHEGPDGEPADTGAHGGRVRSRAAIR